MSVHIWASLSHEESQRSGCAKVIISEGSQQAWTGAASKTFSQSELPQPAFTRLAIIHAIAIWESKLPGFKREPSCQANKASCEVTKSLRFNFPCGEHRSERLRLLGRTCKPVRHTRDRRHF